MVTLAQIMSKEVKTVTPETTLRELAEFLVSERVSGAPVVASGRVVGVVSVSDLLEFDSEGRSVPVYRSSAEADALSGDEEWNEAEGDSTASYYADMWVDAGAEVETRLATDSPEWNALDDHVVSEVMTARLLSLPPTAEVQDAARHMDEAEVHRLLVMEGDSLLGVITSTDIVRAVARHGLGG